MARWENIGVFPTEGFDVADFEMRTWEAFEGPTVKIDHSSKRPLGQSRDEKRKKLDALLKCDFSNDPIKFYKRELLGFADVFHRTRELREIAIKAASGDRDALREKAAVWKRELLANAVGVCFHISPAPAADVRVSDAVRAELVREVKWLDGNLRALEKTVIALGLKIDCLEWESRSAEFRKSLEKKIDDLVIAHNAKSSSEGFAKLDKAEMLNALERDALSGFSFRKNKEEGDAKRNRAAERKERLFLELHKDLRDVEVTRRWFRALFDVELPEETERALLQFYGDRGVQAKRERFRALRGTEHPQDDYRLKTPSKSKAYEYLDKEKKRSPEAP